MHPPQGPADTALGCSKQHDLAIDFAGNLTHSALVYSNLKHMKYLFKILFCCCLQLSPAGTDTTWAIVWERLPRNYRVKAS